MARRQLRRGRQRRLLRLQTLQQTAPLPPTLSPPRDCHRSQCSSHRAEIKVTRNRKDAEVVDAFARADSVEEALLKRIDTDRRRQEMQATKCGHVFLEFFEQLNELLYGESMEWFDSSPNLSRHPSNPSKLARSSIRAGRQWKLPQAQISEIAAEGCLAGVRLSCRGAIIKGLQAVGTTASTTDGFTAG